MFGLHLNALRALATILASSGSLGIGSRNLQRSFAYPVLEIDIIPKITLGMEKGSSIVQI